MVVPAPGGAMFVTDGGLETDLIFHHGFDLPEFAAFPLIDDGRGWEVLASYYRDYARIALALGVNQLREQFPNLCVVGGCCGTDARHVARIWGLDDLAVLR